MYNYLKFTYLFLLITFNAISAEAVSMYDSIYRTCKQNNQNDTEFVKCLDLKSFEIHSSNPRVGLKLAQSALKHAELIKWEKGIALANNEIAINYKTLSQLDSAIYHYSIAQKHFKKLQNLNAESGVIANLSLIYKSKGNYVKAMDLLNQAYKIQDQLNNYKTKAIILENMGSVYLDLGEIYKAKEYYLKAREIYSQKNDSVSIARNMLNLGIILDKIKDYNGAIINLKQALEINLRTNNIGSIQISLANLGIVYLHLKDYSNSISTLLQAIQYSKTIGNEFSLAIDYGNIGEVYLEKYKSEKGIKDLVKAVDYLKKGYFLCDKIGFIPPQIEFADNLVEALEIQGTDYKLAYIVSKKRNFLKDSIFSIDNTIKIHKLESEKEIAIKTNELRISKLKSKLALDESNMHKNQKTILILVVVVLLLVICVLYLLYVNRFRVFKKRMYEISQFQSHQLRSPVAKIIHLSEEISEKDIEKEEFEKLIQMLKDSTDELDKVIHEIVKQTD